MNPNQATLPDWINAGAAVAMLAVSVALWWVSRRQAHLSDTQAKISKAQGIASMRIERAYVHVLTIDASVVSLSQGSVDVVLEVYNSGNTPATIVRKSGASMVVIGPVIPAFDATALRFEPVDFVVGSHKSATYGFQTALTPEQVEVLSTSGDGRLIVFGRMVYTDIFNDEHWGNFGFEYVQLTVSEMIEQHKLYVDGEVKEQSTGQWNVVPGYSGHD